jgi:hypothetical protein
MSNGVGGGRTTVGNGARVCLRAAVAVTIGGISRRTELGCGGIVLDRAMQGYGGYML